MVPGAVGGVGDARPRDVVHGLRRVEHRYAQLAVRGDVESQAMAADLGWMAGEELAADRRGEPCFNREVAEADVELAAVGVDLYVTR